MIQSIGYFELAEFEMKPFDIDLFTHYNDDFADVHNIIFNSLTNKDKNGLILLHGKFGTGKTYYIRHLINSIDRKFIYLPLRFFEDVNSPKFIPFITENKNAVIILEDCESLLIHRETGLYNGSALSTLLNLGDGLLSDALSLNVICTFNAGLKKIDDALLRKGRLIARYEFMPLAVNKAQNLVNQIGQSISIDKPMTLSEIYNIREKNFENAQPKLIGY